MYKLMTFMNAVPILLMSWRPLGDELANRIRQTTPEQACGRWVPPNRRCACGEDWFPNRPWGQQAIILGCFVF
jgi:hypothetical protein